MSEYIIGRAGRAASAVKSMDDLNDRGGTSHVWSSGAWLGMIASFLIVSFYCVVAAWVLAYIPKFLTGAFDGQTPEQIAGQFGTMLESPRQVIPYFLIFGALTAFLVSRGVNRGIEIAAKYLMPLFFVLLIGLAGYAIFSSSEAGGAKKAAAFLFTFDFSKLNPQVAVAALGQACFSLGIGNAIMITYGSYLPRSVSIPKAAVTVGLTDTAVAMIAGFAIFPIVFANGLDFDAGAGIFFQTLPTALSTAFAGNIVGAAFFFLAFFAAITSSVSLLEPSVAWVSEHFKTTKAKAAWMTAAVMIALGFVSVYSSDFFDFIDTGLVGPIIAPLSALLVVLFTGHRLSKEILDQELGGEGEALGRFLMIFVKFIAPVFMAIVLAMGIWDRWLAPLFVTAPT